ncbi:MULTISPECIES: tetratricopeptide repeat protein [unclassified Sulfitobacter]|uniref:tetratricopeptide repeat protein n=1 Tax=unclassified Sulfitobacter TaxID=196795 RepID=UPI0007C31162|nr:MULTISPECIES: tetratricopeptide repeat protein [unclassified Sulfitobacter]KZX94269.1 hypothetical protein A3720_04705 [Sulfitobacter sp. HI0021]KZX95396.1 hypothetical protein A3722_18465 [Sulfitobacter sp. HI0027]KZY97993.1 hypothetical protein A3747_01095 [Sulfitobacter sp. HI0076]
MRVKAQILGLGVFSALATLTIPAVASAEEFQDVHECDRYAAHPGDPHRWAAGVDDHDIIPGPAVQFCRQAVDEYPETPRFAFQLGRALWAANRTDEGTDVFLALEEQFEYGPVYAYLADVYMYGLGSAEVDEELGISLYQIAAEAGFAPAAEVLANLTELGDENDIERAAVPERTTPQNQPVEQVLAPQAVTSQQEAFFNSGQYTQPKMVAALYSGNLSELKPQGVGKSNYAGISNAHVYVASFHKEFSGTVNFKDQTCVTLYDPRITRNLDAKVTRLMTGTPGTSLENSLNQGAQRGWEMMADILTDMSKGGMGALVDTQQNLLELGENGAIDAARLIGRHGCQSEITKRIYANIRAYAFGQPGVLSPEEEERQEKEKAKKAREQEENRKAKLRADAKQNCVAQWKEKPLCQCMVELLEKHEISDGDWQLVRGEFKNVISLSGRYDGLREGLRACRT